MSKALHALSLPAVMLVAFAVQWLASSLQPSPGYFMMSDSAAYWQNATSIHESWSIARPLMPMGASLFMAVCQMVGMREFDVVQWAHPVLNAMNALLAFLLTKRLSGGWRAALLAALAVAVYPPQLNYARQLIAEPWFVTALLAALVLLIVEGGLARACVGGVLLGVAVLVRTPALGVVAVVLVMMAWLRRPLSQVTAVAVGCGLVLAAGCWLVSRSAGEFVFLAKQDHMMVAYRSVPGGWIYEPEEKQHASYLAALREDPADFARQRFWAFANMLSPWPLGPERSLAVRAIIFACDTPLLLAACWAGFRSFRGQGLTRSCLLLLTPALGLVLFHGLLFGMQRYRMPMMVPMICLVAAAWPLPRLRTS